MKQFLKFNDGNGEVSGNKTGEQREENNGDRGRGNNGDRGGGNNGNKDRERGREGTREIIE